MTTIYFPVFSTLPQIYLKKNQTKQKPPCLRTSRKEKSSVLCSEPLSPKFYYDHSLTVFHLFPSKQTKELITKKIIENKANNKQKGKGYQ